MTLKLWQGKDGECGQGSRAGQSPDATLGWDCRVVFRTPWTPIWITWCSLERRSSRKSTRSARATASSFSSSLRTLRGGGLPAARKSRALALTVPLCLPGSSSGCRTRMMRKYVSSAIVLLFSFLLFPLFSRGAGKGRHGGSHAVSGPCSVAGHGIAEEVQRHHELGWRCGNGMRGRLADRLFPLFSWSFQRRCLTQGYLTMPIA